MEEPFGFCADVGASHALDRMAAEIHRGKCCNLSLKGWAGFHIQEAEQAAAAVQHGYATLRLMFMKN